MWGYSARALRWSLRLSLLHDCRPESLKGLWISESVNQPSVMTFDLSTKLVELTPWWIEVGRHFFRSICSEAWSQALLTETVFFDLAVSPGIKHDFYNIESFLHGFWYEHDMNSSNCVKNHLKTCILLDSPLSDCHILHGPHLRVAVSYLEWVHGSITFTMFWHFAPGIRSWNARCVGWRWNARVLTPQSLI